MSTIVTATVTYTNNMRLALMQETAKLAPRAVQQPASGEMQEIENILDSALPERKTTRFQATNLKDGDWRRRWAVRTDEYEFKRGVDSIDKAIARIDHQGAYVKAGSQTLQRAKDIAFLDGFYGPNYTGKTGQTIVTFNAGNIIPVNEGGGGPVGMNVDKLRGAQKVLREGHVDLEAEEAWMALTAEQIADLQAEIEMTSADFNRSDSPVLRDGKLTKLLGFNFIPMQFGDEAVVGSEIAALTLDSNGYRRVPFWVTSGMAMATWEELFARISERADLSYAIQVYARNSQTGTRTDEAKCGQVLCAES